jgi:hypothetical protein
MTNKIFKILFIFFLTIQFLIVTGQERKELNKSILISKSNFQGTLFQENYVFDLSPDKSGRFNVEPLWFLGNLGGDSIIAWTPEINKIELFERGLYILLANYNTEDNYINENTPEIIKNLDQYKRQYIGFKNKKENDCLWIQFVLSAEKLESPDTEIVQILGGGTTVFLVIYNFEENKIEHLFINGPI